MLTYGGRGDYFCPQRGATAGYGLSNGGGKIERVIADLTIAADIESLVTQLPEIDGTVLCAGKGWTMPVKMASTEKINDIMSVNFYAQAELIRQLFKKKRLKQGSSIVILSSIGGNFVFEPGNVMYGVSKAAISSYMHYAANEFSGRKVRVNCICPGMIDTPLIHKGTITEEQLREYEQNYPLKRFGRPEEVAFAAIYLLSDASSWVTGTSLVIDGGSTIKS